MKTTIFAATTAVALAFGSSALANDFNANEISMSASHGIFNYNVEGTANNGFERFSVGAEVLSFGVADNLNSTVDVFGSYRRDTDEFSIGAVAGLSYTLNSFDLYANGEVEYFTRSQTFEVTPTVGASYSVNNMISVFGEVGYTWNASNSWSREGGVAEVGINFAIADNVTLTPSIRHRFDMHGVANNTQAHVGVAFSF
jgi:hypothetical protein